MKIYSFEGKNVEELTLQALKELDVKEDEMVTDVTEETVGLLKKKKYTLKVALKSDILEFAKKFVKDITVGMGIEDVVLESQRTENYIKITMHSENSSLLIGKGGRTLASLQTLLRAAISKEVPFKVNVVLDVENYKIRQEHNIERLAKKLAKEVIKTKEPITMDSMNSYERRLVHNVLGNFKGITTESEGEEPNRKVVIKPIEGKE
ncbi:MAG: KH domain-containing protein [Bacilli bacterium]|nr:KH domain-containing protein [Bacilli bacterium]